MPSSFTTAVRLVGAAGGSGVSVGSSGATGSVASLVNASWLPASSLKEILTLLHWFFYFCCFAGLP